MEGLAKLGLFVRFCQICGFIPFQMEIDSQTKIFKRFTFSFRHLLTWWYVSVQIVIGISIGLLWFYYFTLLRSNNFLASGKKEDLINLPLLIFVLFGTGMFIMVKCSIVRCSLLSKAMHLVKQTDKILEPVSNIVLNKDSVTRRTWIGITFTLCLVKIFLHLSVLWYFHWLFYSMLLFRSHQFYGFHHILNTEISFSKLWSR